MCTGRVLRGELHPAPALEMVLAAIFTSIGSEVYIIVCTSETVGLGPVSITLRIKSWTAIYIVPLNGQVPFLESEPPAFNDIRYYCTNVL